MRYIVIATSRRGTVSPPEYLDTDNSFRMEEADLAFRASQKKMVQRERDRLLTREEWGREEAFRAFLRRPPRRA